MEFTVLSGRHTVSLLKEPVEMAPVGKAQGFHDGGDPEQSEDEKFPWFYDGCGYNSGYRI